MCIVKPYKERETKYDVPSENPRQSKKIWHQQIQEVKIVLIA